MYVSNHIEESELVSGIRKRNKDMLSYIYDQYGSALYGAALRIVQDEEVCKEVIQDVFLKIWNKIDLYNQEKGRFFTWMLNITRNTCLDKLRSKEIKRLAKTYSVENYVYTIESENGTSTPVDGIGVKELMEELVEEQKFILIKIYFEGFTHSEIADEFNIPLGTVKSRLRSALKHLRRKLGN